MEALAIKTLAPINSVSYSLGLYTCRRRISDLPVKCIYDLEYHIIFSGNTCLCHSGTVPSNLRKSSYIFFFWSNSSVEKREPTRSFVKDLQGCFSSEKFCGMSRRRLITEIIALSSAIIHVSPAISLPLQEAKDHEVIRYQKLNTGVKIQDIVEGEGPEAHEGDLVEVNYVCRRSNGYFVHSTVDQFSGESSPVILPLDGKEIIQGLKEVLVGMKVGGKRRALIPPNVGYVNENLKPIPDEFGPRRSLLSHANEPLVFEVQLLKVL